MSSQQIYFVAGASRGIGLAFVDCIATKDPSAIIYAGARDPINGAPLLKALAAKYPRRVELVKYVAGDKEGNDAVAALIRGKYGRVDMVIANAGISNYAGKADVTPIDKFQEHFSVNVLGPVVLFQSFTSLLKASAQPRFIPISSAGGSLGATEAGGMDIAAYGASKAALNFVTRKIHFENEWLIAFPQCPGPVETDMSRPIIEAASGDESERLRGMMRQPAVAAGIMVGIFMASTRETHGGKFWNVEGGTHPW